MASRPQAGVYGATRSPAGFDGEFANRYATYAGTGTLRVSW